jgi:hypothetical protein
LEQVDPVISVPGIDFDTSNVAAVVVRMTIPEKILNLTCHWIQGKNTGAIKRGTAVEKREDVEQVRTLSVVFR